MSTARCTDRWIALGPINDPHAAAADLVEQIVIAELAGRRRFQRRLIQGTAGKSLNQIDVGKVVVFSQRGFMLAMFRKKYRAVSRLAVVDPRHGTAARTAAKPSEPVSLHASRTIALRELFPVVQGRAARNPLAMVAAAAWQVHCNSIEISANERPSRCRRRTASRCLDGNRSSAMQSRS